MVTGLGVIIFAISYRGIEFSYHTQENKLTCDKAIIIIIVSFSTVYRSRSRSDNSNDEIPKKENHNGSRVGVHERIEMTLNELYRVSNENICDTESEFKSGVYDNDHHYDNDEHLYDSIRITASLSVSNAYVDMKLNHY